MKWAIQTFQLGKKYKIPNQALRDFWAISNVNLTIFQGEAIGLVGKNGSGKSTLLKLLARVTHPSSGQIDLYGKTSALLEVGAGFHGELTGKENILLSGAILGMPYAEIKKHFEEIVAFSGIEPFLDTPVKKYSSGMFVRLAFAVLAHLNCQILIVDEILELGDIEFQRKCFLKMQTMVDNGKTILFVSHQIEKIQAFCSRVVWLDQGKVIEDGDTQTVLAQFCNSAQTKV